VGRVHQPERERDASYWPTPEAHDAMPVVADTMNTSRKVVFSRILTDPNWENTDLINDDIVGAMRRKKHEPGPDMVIMGSGRSCRSSAGRA
jgi:dihydrofolate reductase